VVDRRPDIDRCIDRLDDALRRAGAKGLVPAGAAEAVDEIATAIEPWALPADLERLWRRIEVGEEHFVVSAWRLPPLVDVRVALVMYRQVLESAYPLLYGPPLLFPFALLSETRFSVELGTRRTRGGTVLSHEVATIDVEYPSVADLIDVFAELVEAGSFERRPEGRILLDDSAERRARDHRLRANPVAPRLAGLTNDPSSWPEHWLRSAGIDPRDREPLGTTHTIAELLTAAADRPVEGRVAGTVVRLVLVCDGELLLVDDGTATLEVRCPARTSPWGPTHGGRYELAVRLERPPAVATGIRPLDG
jgi:hypothetical protein